MDSDKPAYRKRSPQGRHVVEPQCAGSESPAVGESDHLQGSFMNDNADPNWRRDNPPKIDLTRAYLHYMAMAAQAKAMRLFGEANMNARQVSPRVDRQ
jgi:hypothetical protein